jgi:hypothetical protein
MTPRGFALFLTVSLLPGFFSGCDGGAFSQIQREGQTITIRGGHSHTTVDEGPDLRIRIDDKEIVVADGQLTVEGATQALPPFKDMEIALEDGEIRVVLDGQAFLGSGNTGEGEGPGAGGGAAGRDGSVLRLRTVPIMDPSGFAQPVVAQTVLLPSDWQVQGGVRWKVGSVCPNDLVETRFLATSPDGQLAFEILPLYHWEWGEDQISQATIQMSGCRLAPPLDGHGVLAEYILPALRPGARVISSDPSPEAAHAAYDEYYSVIGPLLQMQNGSMRTDAMRVLLQYETGGTPYEEALTFSLAEIVSPMMVGRILSYTANHIYAFRSPRGRMEGHSGLYATIVGSIRNNPVWQAALVRVATAMNTQASIAAGNRAAIWRDAMTQVGEMRVRTWQQNQETLSGVSRAWSRAIRGVDGYLDPITQQTVELATGYQNAWSNGSGEYVLAVDPSFDPNTELSGEWQRMRAMEH